MRSFTDRGRASRATENQHQPTASHSVATFVVVVDTSIMNVLDH